MFTVGNSEKYEWFSVNHSEERSTLTDNTRIKSIVIN